MTKEALVTMWNRGRIFSVYVEGREGNSLTSVLQEQVMERHLSRSIIVCTILKFSKNASLTSQKHKTLSRTRSITSFRSAMSIIPVHFFLTEIQATRYFFGARTNTSNRKKKRFSVLVPVKNSWHLITEVIPFLI
jgi:hypothetical protein